MTIENIISRVNEIKPNAYSEEALLGFLNTLEGRIQREVWLRLPGEMLPAYDFGEDREKVPLMPAPYDEAYIWYICAMVDALNGEYSKYQNTLQIANEQMRAYQNWFISTYEPAQANRTPELLGSVSYTETSGEAVELCTLPAGDLLMLVICNVEAAFDSGTADELILGTADDDDALMAAGDIEENETGLYAVAVNLTGGVAGTKICAKLTKTGDDATQGAASFYGRILHARNGWEEPA